MKDTDKMDAMNKMDAKDFSEALWNKAVHSEGEWPPIIASRDAYRERQALEEAAKRADEWWNGHEGQDAGLRAAILGTPRFERGQLVEMAQESAFTKGHTYVWGSHAIACPHNPELYTPVLDREGRPVYLPVED